MKNRIQNHRSVNRSTPLVNHHMEGLEVLAQDLEEDMEGLEVEQ